MSERDLDSESEAKDASTLKSLTPPVVADLIRKAPGLPAMTARDRPGNLCLSKVMANFQSGTGSFSHLQWECYTSSEEEKLAERRGERKVTKLDFAFKDRTLIAEQSIPEVEKLRIEDVVRLGDVLHLRSLAHAIVGVCDFAVYNDYHSELLRCYKTAPPSQMRGPTINEIRLTDRLIHEEIFQYLSEGTTSMAAGLVYFVTGAGRASAFWRFTECRAKAEPDLGLEPDKPADKTSSKGNQKGAQKGKQTQVQQQAPAASGQGVCSVCGKTRAEHPQKRFCSLPGKGKGKPKNKETAHKSVKRASAGDEVEKPSS